MAAFDSLSNDREELEAASRLRPIPPAASDGRDRRRLRLSTLNWPQLLALRAGRSEGSPSISATLQLREMSERAVGGRECRIRAPACCFAPG